jgi:alpha-galactosidase/6-phospho-beta-glucosidase family protein
LHFDYLGLNHLGWVRSIRDQAGVELLPSAGFSRYNPKMLPARLFPTEFIQKLGLLPTEYLYFYYFPEAAYKNTERSGQSRGQAIAGMNVVCFRNWRRLGIAVSRYLRKLSTRTKRILFQHRSHSRPKTKGKSGTLFRIFRLRADRCVGAPGPERGQALFDSAHRS